MLSEGTGAGNWGVLLSLRSESNNVSPLNQETLSPGSVHWRCRARVENEQQHLEKRIAKVSSNVVPRPVPPSFANIFNDVSSFIRNTANPQLLHLAQSTASPQYLPVIYRSIPKQTSPSVMRSACGRTMPVLLSQGLFFSNNTHTAYHLLL